MQENSKIFVGLDTSKMKICVALAEEGRQGEVRFLGDIDNTPDAVLSGQPAECNTLIMSDSAGGGLALSAPLKIRDERVPHPAALPRGGSTILSNVERFNQWSEGDAEGAGGLVVLPPARPCIGK